MSDFTLNQRWSASLVGALVSTGVRHAVICPGSRSTPLALAFAERSAARPEALGLWSIIDERSAGFFALGLAKSTGAPVALVCTSGTAGAHFLPAVMEASEGAVPLVVLTADRPWELHGFGAPQTVAQVGLFGRHVRYADALPAPDELALEHLVAIVQRAALAAQRSPRGPVHLNVPFREPLAPPSGSPGPLIDPPLVRHASARLQLKAPPVHHAKRGVIVVGPHEADDGFGAWVHALGERLQFPVLAEAASNTRFGFPGAITFVDTLLRNAAFAEAMKPDVVLRFGGGLTPKIPQQWLDASGATVLQIHVEGLRFDPSHRASHFLDGLPEFAAHPPTAEQRQTWATWRAAQQQVEHALSAEPPVFTEPFIAREVVRALPAGASLMVSSSMPVRDVDAFASRGAPMRVFANRGVNGIDGVTSTALGVAAGRRAPTALLIGDVALLHDLTGWLIARRYGLSLTVIVVNNDGGGIFHFLPIAERSAHFEALFGTPHGVDVAHVAALAGAQLHRPTELDGLGATVRRCLEGGLHLIEVRTDRRENVDAHRSLQSRLAEAIS